MTEPKPRTRQEIEAEAARIVADLWKVDPWTHPHQARVFLEALRLMMDLRRTSDTLPGIWPST